MNVIGPIDQATWYSMRQCRESVAYLKTLNNPIFDIEIKGEEALLRTFMSEVLGKKAA